MRRTVLTVPFAVLSAIALLAGQAFAQDTKSARGTVTAMSADTITVKAGERDLKLSVDAKTEVIAEGGSTATRKAEAAGKSGPKLAELLKVGDAVEVNYHEMGATLHAARIRRVLSAGSGGGTTSDAKPQTQTANGRVEEVSMSSLTISGSSGRDASFRQTFTIDSSTRVVGEGAGTAAAAKGGKLVVTDYLAKGDQVTVTYHTTGATLHAAEIRVRGKGK